MATIEAPPRLQVRLHEGPFRNETPVDFTHEENARKMRSAIEKVRGQLGRTRNRPVNALNSVASGMFVMREKM